MRPKRRQRLVLGWFLTAALVFSIARAPAAGAAADGARDPADPERVAIFERIAQAWGTGDAGALLELFGSRKVVLSLPEMSLPSGRFSRDQSYLILKSYFESTRTQEFRFVDTSEPGEPRGMAVGLASRKYRTRGDGRVVQDRVLVALVPEGERWVVAQIQSLR